MAGNLHRSHYSGAENRRFDPRIETYSMVPIAVKIQVSSLTGVRVAERVSPGITWFRQHTCARFPLSCIPATGV